MSNEHSIKFLGETVIDNRFCKQQPTPKQTEFLLRQELEVLYGGAAAGGKSSALLMAALQYVFVPGYSALILRRTYADLALPGAIMDRSISWLTNTDAHWHAGGHTWSFPTSGTDSTLTFGYLESEQDKYRYQSAEFQFCVAEGTPVLMADGSYKPIEKISLGEKVQTLEGSKAVTYIGGRSVKECVNAITYDSNHQKVGEQVHPIDHEFLTPFGWASYISICSLCGISESIQYHCDRKSLSQFEHLSQFVARSSLSLRPSMRPTELVRSPPGHPIDGEIDASLINCQNGCEVSDGLLRGVPLPGMLCVPVVLYAHPIHSGSCRSSDCVSTGALHEMETTLGSQLNCSAYSRLDDGLSHCPPISDPNEFPLPNDAGEHIPTHCKTDVSGHTQLYNQLHLALYDHPYKREIRSSSEAVQVGSCTLTPIGERKVYDITVEDVHHYITLALLVNKNCGFDELTQFTETQYSYLFSRLRKLKDVDIPIRMRSASNPGGVGHQWVQARFQIGSAYAHLPRDPNRIFVGAKLYDNPHIDQAAYVDALNKLDYVTRIQLMNGDWEITESGGIFFNPKTIDIREVDLSKCKIYGACDPSEGGADYSAIVTLLKLPDGRVVVWECDMRNENQSNTIDRIIQDYKAYTHKKFFIEANSLGQAKGAEGMGLFEKELRARMTEARAIVPFSFMWNTKKKEDRIRALEPHYSNGTLLFRSDWNQVYPKLVSQFKAFKPGSKVHDDGPDAVEMAYSGIMNLIRLDIPIPQKSIHGRGMVVPTW